ncbi:hypothetical protein ACSHWB_14190 [Lentzea sp. HUAS TT2]|uniref:hypothetical protein n=1 Tax=Lentzea sp. HUAS TT2 TaxID=3447454 RepID=UPI003F6F3693
MTTVQRTETTTSGVVLLQAVASVLVVYSYLIGQNFDLGFIRTVLNRPLGLGEDFGPFALLLLLAASGYTAMSDRSSIKSRLVRTYLPAAVAVALAAIVVTLGAPIWNLPADSHTSPLAVVGNLALVSPLITGAPLLVPLAWVVLLQLIGIGAAALTNRFGVLVPIGQLVAVTVVVLLAPESRAAQVLVFYPLVVLGHLVALHRRGAVATWVATVVGVLGAVPVVVLNGVNEEFAKWWYPLASLIAALLFTVSVVFSGESADRLAAPAPVRWLAVHAIWFVVLVGVVGYPVLALFGGVG